MKSKIRPYATSVNIISACIITSLLKENVFVLSVIILLMFVMVIINYLDGHFERKE